MKSKLYSRGARSYYRGGPKQATSSGKTILIVSEGEETEPQYFNARKDRLKLGSAVIVTVAKGTDARSVVASAKERKKAREREARRSRYVAYDEVWCVFDSESPQHRPHLAEALVMARDNKINVALSRPCFEFWLLLHEEYTTKSFTDCASVVPFLKQYYPDYEKSIVPTEQLLAKLTTAVTHARRLRADNKRSGQKEPASDVDRLACSMNEAIRQELRYDLRPEDG